MEFKHPLNEFTGEANTVMMRLNSNDERIKGITTKICFLASNVQARLFYYGSLCNRFENMFQAEKDDFDSKLSKIGEKIKTDELQGEPMDLEAAQVREQQWLFDERILVQETAVAVGIFLKSYALFENVLNELCDIYKELKLTSISYKDLNGGGIVRAANYIKHMVNINNFSTEEWKYAKAWNTVRNQVIHQDSKINDNEKLEQALNLLDIDTVRDTTLVDNNDIINLRIGQVIKFIYLIDKTLSKFVLHEDNWI